MQNPSKLRLIHSNQGCLQSWMVTVVYSRVSCTCLISADWTGLVNGSDCQRYEQTGEKNKLSRVGVGVAHYGSPRVMFTLCLMRGEVVNLGNKEWGIPLCHWRCRCYIAQKRHSPPKPPTIKKKSFWGTFVEMWTVLMGVWGLENGEWKQTFFVGTALYFLSNNSRVGWLADLNNKYSRF